MNKEQYKAFLTKQKYVPIFGQVWWLDACAGSVTKLSPPTTPQTIGWDVAIAKDENGNVIGAMPFAFRRRWFFFKTIDMPPLTPWFPIIMSIPQDCKKTTLYAWEHNILKALLDNLDTTPMLSIMCESKMTNVLPFFWKNFSPLVRTTYIIDLQIDINTIFANFRENVRRNIRKAEKCLQVVERDDPLSFYNLCKHTLTRQNITILYSFEYWQHLYKAIKSHQAGQTLFAIDDNDVVHAAICIVWDEESVYYLIGGTDTDLRVSGAMSLLFWEVIQRSKAKGLKKFDLVGANVPHIERFKLGFGGERVNYFRMLKFNSRILSVLFALRKS